MNESVPAAELVVQLGDATDLSAIALSGDGHVLATASWDHTVRLWDAVGALELRRIELPENVVVRSLALSGDGGLVLTGGDEGDARLWDARTGGELVKLSGHTGRVTAVAMSRDGTVLVTGGRDRSVRHWRRGDRVELRRVNRYSDEIAALSLSDDGRRLLVGVHLRADVVETETGRTLIRFVDHGGGVTAVALSADGRRALTGSLDRIARLWDAESGKELQRYVGHGQGVTAVALARDGQFVATGSRDGTLRIWESRGGREMASIPVGDARDVLVALDPAEQRVFGAAGRLAHVWDLRSMRRVVSFKGAADWVSSVAFSPDGKRLVVGSWDNTARVWDGVTGMQALTLQGHRDDVRAVGFSSDGRRLLTGGRDGARLWEARTGAELHRFGGHEGGVRPVAFSGDGRHVLTGGDDGTVRVWDSQNYAELARLGPLGNRVTGAAFSKDGKRIVSSSADTVFLWDWRVQPDRRRVGRHKLGIESVCFSPDGLRILSAGLDATARVWDAETGVELLLLEHPRAVYSASYEPHGGRRIITGGEDGVVRLWDAKTGTQQDELRGHAGWVFQVTFSPDGRFALSAGTDQTTRLWDLASRAELCRLVAFDDTEKTWAVVDQKGRFDASRGGEVSGLHWVVGLEAIGLEQLKERYYEPGLLAKKLGLSPEPQRDVAAFNKPALHPDVTVNQPTSQDPVLRVALINRGGGIGRVVVLVNGKEMSDDVRPRGTDPSTNQLTIELPLSRYFAWLNVGRQNHIEVRAYNADGYLVSRGAEVIYEAPGDVAPSDVTLWAVIVGISDYGGEQIDLRYAAKDAEDIAQAVDLGARRLFGATHARFRLLASGRSSTEEYPTKANIARAFDELRNAGPGDVLFIYLAGHGVAVRDVYYYPTQEAQSTNLEDAEVRDERSVSSVEIANWVKRSPATRRQVLILDTCAAGAAVRSLVEERSAPADQIRALDRLKDSTGVHVLMGSAADRISYEASQFEQGILTHALLRGMKGAALRDDQYVDVTRLLNYAVDEVPRLAADIGGIQRPLIAAPKLAQMESFDIGKLSSEDRAAIPLRSPKPLLLHPSLLNGKTASDDLQLESKLRARLREASFARARGAGQSSPVVFVESDELAGAIRPSGLYFVENGRLRAMLVLQRDADTDDSRVNLQVEGERSDLPGFVEKMMQSIMRAAQALK